MPSLLPRKSTDSSVKTALGAAQGQLQTQSHPRFDREPLLAEIPEQGFVLADVAGTIFIYVRIGNNRYKSAMTLV